jgi:hypothetical protein
MFLEPPSPHPGISITDKQFYTTSLNLCIFKSLCKLKFICFRVTNLYKNNIDKNYAVVKCFPTLSKWVYLQLISIRHVNTIRQDSKKITIVLLRIARSKVFHLLVSLPVGYGKSLIYYI